MAFVVGAAPVRSRSTARDMRTNGLALILLTRDDGGWTFLQAVVLLLLIIGFVELVIMNLICMNEFMDPFSPYDAVVDCSSSIICGLVPCYVERCRVSSCTLHAHLFRLHLLIIACMRLHVISSNATNH